MTSEFVRGPVDPPRPGHSKRGTAYALGSKIDFQILCENSIFQI